MVEKCGLNNPDRKRAKCSFSLPINDVKSAID